MSVADSYEVHTFTLDGGPWHGYTAGGCMSTQCEDCTPLPKVLEWDTPKGRYRYVYSGSSASSDGPFYHWHACYTWDPANAESPRPQP